MAVSYPVRMLKAKPRSSTRASPSAFKCRSSCSQLSTSGRGDVPSKGGMYNLLSAQKTGSQGDLHSICVTKTTQDPSPNPYHELVFLTHSIDPIVVEGAMCT